jgi:glycosyltransferase involved in cell wall biosynthesis
MSRHLLLLCPNPVGERMRGLGIRYTEIARALHGDGVEVTLAAPAVEGAAPEGVHCTTWSLDRLRPLRTLLAGVDAVLAPPGPPHVMRALRRADARVAIDLYDPVPLEVLERFRGARSPLRTLHSTTATDQLEDALRTGHFYVCASERQRDLWLGALLVLGLLTPAAHDRDPTLRSLIDVMPFGVPTAPPRPGAAAHAIRERFAQICPEDRVLLWNGGLWRWLDAPSAIRAVARVRANGTSVRLVFMGASEAGGAAQALAEARATVARERLGEAVLFNDRWVDYHERGAWLLDADAAISTHRDHLETRFAFRTRLLDCLWAGLPPVVTGGDELAAQIARLDLGAVSEPDDVAGLAAGIEVVLARGRDAYAPRLRAAAEAYTWPRVVAPLRAFVTGRDRDVSVAPSPLARPGAAPARRVAQRVTRAARALRG